MVSENLNVEKNKEKYGRKMYEKLRTRHLEIEQPEYNIAGINRLEVPASNVWLHFFGENMLFIKPQDVVIFRRALLEAIQKKQTKKLNVSELLGSDLNNVSVAREQSTEKLEETGKSGRLDILLHFKDVGKAIIIENKIENNRLNDLKQYIDDTLQKYSDLQSPEDISVVYLTRTKERRNKIKYDDAVNSDLYETILTYDEVLDEVKGDALSDKTLRLLNLFEASYTEHSEYKWNLNIVRDNMEVLSEQVPEFENDSPDWLDERAAYDAGIQSIKDFGNGITWLITREVLDHFRIYATKSTVQTGNKYIFNGSKKLAEWERPSLSAFELHYQYDESQFVNGEFGKVGLKVYPYRKTWEKTQDEANKHELEPIINLKQFVNWDLGTQREKFDAVVNEIVEKLESDSFIEKRD